MKKRRISVIVANYNEQENIEAIYKRIVDTFQPLVGYTYEILFIDNASTDDSTRLYINLCKRDKQVKVVEMSRNFGSPQSSFLAGFTYASGHACVLLHGDIQDPPELIPKFITKWEQGYDVVYGIREKRIGYGILWNFWYSSFYYILNKLSYFPIPRDAGDFSLMDKIVVAELLTIEEYDYYLRCLRAFVGFRQIGIPYIRASRERGHTSSTFLSGLYSARLMIINFSFKPLTWIAIIGFITMFSSILFIIYDLIHFLFFRNAPPGVPTILLVVLFLGSVQILSLSVLAEYVSRIFLEVKHRPRYIVRRTHNIKRRPTIS